MPGQLGRADPAHQEARRAEEATLGHHDQRDRQADPQDLAQALPVRPPPVAEQAVAPQPPVAPDRRDIGGERGPAGHDRRQGRAFEAQRGQAEMTVDEGPVAEHVDQDRGRRDHRREDRPAHRRDEGAQHVGRDQRHDPPADDAEEGVGALGDARVLPGRQHDRLAEQADGHRQGAARHGQPQGHAHRAPDLADRVAARAALGRDQRGDRAGQARQRPGDQHEDRDRQAGRRQRLLPEPRDEDHVDRAERHLQQVGERQRPGDGQGGAQLGAEGGRRNGPGHAAGPDRRGSRRRKAPRFPSCRFPAHRVDAPAPARHGWGKQGDMACAWFGRR